MKSTSTGSSISRAEVAHEEHRPLQDTDQQRRVAVVVGGDGGAQLGHPHGQLLGTHQTVPDRRLGPHGHQGRRRGRLHRGDTIRAPLEHQTAVPPTHPQPPGELGGPCLAACDGQHPGHLGGARGVLVGRVGPTPRGGAAPDRPQPPADGSAGQAHGCAGQRRAVRRVGHLGGRQPVEQRALVPGQVGLAGQHGHRVPATQIGAERQQFVTDPVAQVPGVVVGGVPRPAQAEPLAQGLGLGAPEPEQRVPAARCHRGQAVESGTPEQVRQDRLRLVVHRVTGRHLGGQAVEASRPGPGFEVGPVGQRHRARVERRAETLGGRSHQGRLVRPAGPQPVVDVDRRHHAARGGRQRQQRQRVRAPRDRAGQGGAGGGNEQRATSAATCSASVGTATVPWFTRRGRPRPGPGDPLDPDADLRKRREPVGTPPHPVEERGPADPLDLLHERLTLGVLAQLGLEPEQLLDEAGDAVDLAPSLVEYPAEAGGPGIAPAPARSMVTSPWPSSRLISAWIRWIAADWSGVATRPSMPESLSGLRPALTSSAARRTAPSRRVGSAAGARGRGRPARRNGPVARGPR